MCPAIGSRGKSPRRCPIAKSAPPPSKEIAPPATAENPANNPPQPQPDQQDRHRPVEDVVAQDVADFVRTSPATAGYGVSTPVAPPTGAPAATGYVLYVNCATRQVVAVPGSKTHLAATGYQPPPGWTQWQEIVVDPSSMQKYLDTYVNHVLANACPK